MYVYALLVNIVKEGKYSIILDLLSVGPHQLFPCLQNIVSKFLG